MIKPSKSMLLCLLLATLIGTINTRSDSNVVSQLNDRNVSRLNDIVSTVESCVQNAADSTVIEVHTIYINASSNHVLLRISAGQKEAYGLFALYFEKALYKNTDIQRYAIDFYESYELAEKSDGVLTPQGVNLLLRWNTSRAGSDKAAKQESSSIDLLQGTVRARLSSSSSERDAVKTINSALDHYQLFFGETVEYLWYLLLKCDLCLLESKPEEAKEILDEAKSFLDEMQKIIPQLFKVPNENEMRSYQNYYNHLYERYSNSVIKLAQVRQLRGCRERVS